jgi:hypothetical protein
MHSFSCYDGDKNEWQKTISIAKSVVNDLENQFSILEKKADTTTGKIMPVENVGGAFSGRYSNIENYGAGRHGFPLSLENCVKAAKQFAVDTYNVTKVKHEKNSAAIENNIKLVEQIKLYMQNIGIPNTFSETDYKSKARFPKKISHSAGYIDDIVRNIKTSDGWENVERDYKRMNEDIEKYIVETTNKEKQKEADVAAKKKFEEKEMMRGTIVVKYALPYTANWDDILVNILNRNKYLSLAHYLCKNRGDWSDGYDYAETGLCNFIVTTETDRLIYDCISDCITNWDGDGRIFRDCEWNYDRIFSLIEDADLLKDYEIANANVN